MKYKYYYGGALIGKAEIVAINKVVKSNYWPLAKEGEKMEAEAANFLGVKHGILTNSGSSAGLLALSALELPRGGEVIIPATTFPTIFNIILQCGLVPVVVDCSPKTNNVDIEKLESAINENTKAIIAVHMVGLPADMDEIVQIAARHKLFVLEDNCDAWGSEYKGIKTGAIGDISFTSFHAAHIVAMGQGGGVFTRDDELARKVRMYRDWGRQSNIPARSNGDKWPLLPKDQDARFIYEKIGYNLSPLELQAAMGRVQLKKTKKIKDKRVANYNYLKGKLEKFSDLQFVDVQPEVLPCWFSLPLATINERAPLIAHLEKNGIETRSMQAGNILKHPAYANAPHRVGNDLSGANWILEHSFWIGVHPRYSKKDLDWVVSIFETYYKNA